MKIYIIPHDDGDGLDDYYFDYKFDMDDVPINFRIKKRVRKQKTSDAKQIGWDMDGNPLYNKYKRTKFYYEDVEEIVTYYGWICSSIEDLAEIMKRFGTLYGSDLILADPSEDIIVWEARC